MTRTTTRRVVEADGPPIDLDAWLRMYVAAVLELEGIAPSGVAATPNPYVG